MTNRIPILAALALACLCTPTWAQQNPDEKFQQEQQACENDVYTYCNDDIPDQDRIAACLHKNLRKISHQCRDVMKSYGRKHPRHRG